MVGIAALQKYKFSFSYWDLSLGNGFPFFYLNQRLFGNYAKPTWGEK